MMDLPDLLVGLSVTAAGYHYFGYPVLLRHLASRTTRPFSANMADVAVEREIVLPTVAVIVPAHNDAAVIGAKITNLAALDYPPELLRVVIALDGCTDATKDIADPAI